MADVGMEAAAAVVEDTPLGMALDTVVQVEVEVGAVLIW